jgi:hypothetical protein
VEGIYSDERDVFEQNHFHFAGKRRRFYFIGIHYLPQTSIHAVEADTLCFYKKLVFNDSFVKKVGGGVLLHRKRNRR